MTLCMHLSNTIVGMRTYMCNKLQNYKQFWSGPWGIAGGVTTLNVFSWTSQKKRNASDNGNWSDWFIAKKPTESHISLMLCGEAKFLKTFLWCCDRGQIQLRWIRQANPGAPLKDAEKQPIRSSGARSGMGHCDSVLVWSMKYLNGLQTYCNITIHQACMESKQQSLRRDPLGPCTKGI